MNSCEPRKFAIQGHSSGRISGVSLLCRVELSEIDVSSVFTDLRHPPAAMARDPLHGSPILRTAICNVLKRRSHAKIGYAVVISHAVYVVDISFRPLSVNVEPRQSVDLESSFFEDNAPISSWRELANLLPHAMRVAAGFPCHEASCRIIINPIAQHFRCDPTLLFEV